MFLYMLYIIVPVAILYAYPGALCTTTIRSLTPRSKKSKKLKKLPVSKVILSYVPVYQMILLRKTLYNGHAGYTVPIAIAIPVLLVTRLLVYFLLPYQLLYLITAIGVIVALLLHHALYVLVVYDMAKMVQGSVPLRVATIFFPFGTAGFIKLKFPKTIAQHEKEKRFKEEVTSCK